MDRVAGRSIITRARARSPLRILTPRAGFDAAWAVVSTFGGGLLAGDSIVIELEVGEDAACLLGSQAQTKVYRSPVGPSSRQKIIGRIERGGLLVCLAEPISCFKDARFQQEQTFELCSSASLVWIDVFTSGRAARGERWAFTQYHSRCDVHLDSELVFRDALRLDQADGPIAAAHRMGQCNCFASALVIGPRVAAHAERIMRWSLEQKAESGCGFLFCVSPVEGGIVIRVAGIAAESVMLWLQSRLDFLTELLGGNPWDRKW